MTVDEAFVMAVQMTDNAIALCRRAAGLRVDLETAVVLDRLAVMEEGE